MLTILLTRDLLGDPKKTSLEMILDDDIIITKRLDQTIAFKNKLLKYVKTILGSFYGIYRIDFGSVDRFKPWSPVNQTTRFPERLYVWNLETYQYYIVAPDIDTIRSVNHDISEAIGRGESNSQTRKKYKSGLNLIARLYYEDILKIVDEQNLNMNIKTIRITRDNFIK